jgi:hypothetical protein
MIDIPQEVKEAGVGLAEKRALNKLIKYVRTLRPIQNDTVEIQHTVNGVSIRAKGGSSSPSTSTAPVWG